MDMGHLLDVSKWARVNTVFCMPKWRHSPPAAGNETPHSYAVVGSKWESEYMGPAVAEKFCTVYVASCYVCFSWLYLSLICNTSVMLFSYEMIY
jgi:hypothetical protein